MAVQFRGSMNEVLSLCELTNGEVALLWEDGTVAVLEVDPPAIEDSLQRYLFPPFLFPLS
jgi:hypothetical protein